MQDGRANARPASVTAGDLDTGARIGRYVIIERVGTGAMGVVYGAYDPELDRKVALKLIKPGQGVKDTARARLLREAKAIARLQHPNVVAVHDVGVFEDQVFLAMEFVAGGTIKSWLAEKPRSWREILDVFIAAGRGLAAAHAAGLVHRDFKPDNVLLDKEGRPRVVDFGIARQAGAGDDELAGETGDVIRRTERQTLRDSSGKHALATLTKTGTWVGTPAYMAPEQFLGERGDEKSDQFSFCVALYEALYGERPFAGDDMLSISVNVTTEQLRPLPKDRGVPTWVRRVILRGLQGRRRRRAGTSMAALIARARDDPAVKLRRRLDRRAAIAVVVGDRARRRVADGVAAARRGRARDRAARRATAERDATAARAKAAEARDLRGARLRRVRRAGQGRGRGAVAADARAAAGDRRAATTRPSAASRRRSCSISRAREIRAQLAGRSLRAPAVRGGVPARRPRRRSSQERLAAVDADGSKREALGRARHAACCGRRRRRRGSCSSATNAIRRPGAGTRRRSARSTARSRRTLAPGSYRLALDGPGLAHVVYPFEVRRGEQVAVDLSAAARVGGSRRLRLRPAGRVLVRRRRRAAAHAVPRHGADPPPPDRRVPDRASTRRRTREWIAFLDVAAAAERRALRPDVSTAIRAGRCGCARTADGWQLAFQPTTQRYAARSRASRSSTWAASSARARTGCGFRSPASRPRTPSRYLAWLRDTGRVPGARLCTELEWERAARGADDRSVPARRRARADDANFDVTYGRVDSAYGPDVVGSHPASRSPFGVDDLAATCSSS